MTLLGRKTVARAGVLQRQDELGALDLRFEPTGAAQGRDVMGTGEPVRAPLASARPARPLDRSTAEQAFRLVKWWLRHEKVAGDAADDRGFNEA